MTMKQRSRTKINNDLKDLKVFIYYEIIVNNQTFKFQKKFKSAKKMLYIISSKLLYKSEI